MLHSRLIFTSNTSPFPSSDHHQQTTALPCRHTAVSIRNYSKQNGASSTQQLNHPTNINHSITNNTSVQLKTNTTTAHAIAAATIIEASPLTDRVPNSEKPKRRATTSLKIAIIGYGNFGQFLARTFAEQGHQVLAHSRTDYSAAAESIGAKFFRDPDDLFEEQPDIVLLCTSILSTESVLRSLPLQRLRRNTLVADVLSVKEFPRNLLLKHLPPESDILCTHPMFGPESGKNGWVGLPFVFDKVRIGEDEDRVERCRKFLEIFERAGCRMVEMSCEKHDETAAEIQFLTHTVGRVLAKLKLKSTSINTKGYETLLNLVQNTCSDSVDLYNGLFMYNSNSTQLIEKLDGALDATKKELFERLHGQFRKQLMMESSAPH